MKASSLSRCRRALADAKEYVAHVRSLARIPMWRYPKERLKDGYSLTDLWDRTMAAQACGHEVVLRADENGLHVEYVRNVRLVPPPEIYSV